MKKNSYSLKIGKDLNRNHIELAIILEYLKTQHSKLLDIEENKNFPFTEIILKHADQILEEISKINFSRLKVTREVLLNWGQSRCCNKILPPATPCESLNDRIWRENPDEINAKNNWIGHGYYWTSNQSELKDTIGPGDFDSIETNFVHLPQSYVVIADYCLLKKDFPELQNNSNLEIDDWLIKNCAFMSQRQVGRIQPTGELGEYLKINENVKFNDECNKIGFRYKGGGRSVNFIINDEFSFDKEIGMTSSFINVKGCGIQNLALESSLKDTGMLSMADALKEFYMEKLISRISEYENCKWSTIHTYCVIDLGIKYKDTIANPSTGYKGDAQALIVRSGHSRFISNFDEPAYYSVLTCNELEKHAGNNIISSLKKYFISSEQEPSVYFGDGETDLSGGWNIQTDATGYNLVDFSQYYVLPDSVLEPWRFSTGDFYLGIISGFALKKIESNPLKYKSTIAKFMYFETESELDSIQIANKKKQQLFEEEAHKKGKSLIGLRKSEYSWSWFLEYYEPIILKSLINEIQNNKKSFEYTPKQLGCLY